MRTISIGAQGFEDIRRNRFPFAELARGAAASMTQRDKGDYQYRKQN